MQLPFVLQSAETMKTAVAYLEPHMEKAEARRRRKGRLVLATVKGDVHDIGKNLVDIILTNNGYEVHNLGIKVSIAEMIEKALEVKADAIGMRGLLVKSTLIMRDNLEELNARGLADDPGAARRRRADAHLRRARPARGLRRPPLLRQGRLRGPPRHGPPRRAQAAAARTTRDCGREPGGRDLPRARAKAEVDPSTIPARSPEVETDNPVFVPPFLGSKVVKGIALDDIAAYINETALFRNQWQFRPEKGDGEPRPTRSSRTASARRCGRSSPTRKAEDLLVPQVVYGYFAANGDGNDLVIWKDETRTAEWLRFRYPRQTRRAVPVHRRLLPSGRRRREVDYAAFHIVTMGSAV